MKKAIILPCWDANTCYAHRIRSSRPVGRQKNTSQMWSLSREQWLKWTLEATHHCSTEKNSVLLSGKVVFFFWSGSPLRWLLYGGCASLSFHADEKEASIDFFFFFVLEIYEEKVFRSEQRRACAHPQSLCQPHVIIQNIQTFIKTLYNKVLWHCGELLNVAVAHTWFRAILELYITPAKENKCDQMSFIRSLCC